ncbi:MAG TPA: CvpA family protein [Verrucomicrobiae bacterium]|nr:CvpA family protein [Verrucomicrobiae bacterium]
MLVAAATPPATQGLPFGWFDLVVIAVLGFGLFRGRRNGMAKEFLPVLEWLVLVAVAGLGYWMLAGILASFIHNLMWNCIISYLALALVVFIGFAILKRRFAERLVKSDLFKGGEYYLGMLSGMVRYGCVLIFAMALLNAPVFTAKDIQQQRERDQMDFGGGAGSGFKGNYFPHISGIQMAVFKGSFLGPRIKDGLGILLINTDQAGGGGSQKPRPQAVIKIGN